MPALVVAASCKDGRGSREPDDAAIHIPRIGHTEPVDMPAAGQSPTTTLPPATAVPTRAAPRSVDDALSREANEVAALIELWWANRAEHERLDGNVFDEAMRSFQQQAKLTSSRPAYAESLRYATCRLGDAQLRLIESADAARDWSSGLGLVLTRDGIVVAANNSGVGKGAAPKLGAGDRLVEADGEEIAEYIGRVCLRPGSTPAQRRHQFVQTLASQRRLDHELPQPTRLTFERSGGDRYTIDLDWQSRPETERVPCVEATVLDKKARIAKLNLNTFWCTDGSGQPDAAVFERQLSEALEGLPKKIDKLVVDVRNNAGGTPQQAKIAAGWLREGSVQWAKTRAKVPYEGFGAWEVDTAQLPGKSKALKSAPLWILIGPGCADTCELFVRALRSTPNVQTVGMATAGSVTRADAFKLPYSGLMLAVPTVQFADPKSEALLEGQGLAPDFEAHPTREEAAGGRDVVLSTALSNMR